MIITFANQKGGAGKTTLLLLLANYLALKGESLLVVDTDYQKSALFLREEDLKSFPEQQPLYQIIEQALDDPLEVTKYLKEIKNQIPYILIDTPGNITEPGLFQVFALSDYIVTPYQYERKCLDSTGTFVSAILQIKAQLRANGLHVPELLFVPERVKGGEGTREEKSVWLKTDEALALHGMILPKLPELSCLKRINTLALAKEQAVAALPFLGTLYKEICQTTSSTDSI